jgi:predicted amidohydrolase
MATIRIAIAQMDTLKGQPEANLATAQALATQAQAMQAELMVLPELWLHGYDLDRAATWAAPLGEGGFTHMQRLAQGSGLYICGSTMERHEAGISNTSALYAPDGTLLGSYRKIHLFRLMQEHRTMVGGDHATVCDTPWGPVGLAVCYDVRFPELARELALGGAVMLLLPAQWPVTRLDAWLTLTRARAIENELFMVACNRVGVEDGVTFPGQSAVIDPLGKVLVRGDDREGVLLAEADMAAVETARRYMTVFEDRRPAAYRIA